MRANQEGLQVVHLYPQHYCELFLRRIPHLSNFARTVYCFVAHWHHLDFSDYRSNLRRFFPVWIPLWKCSHNAVRQEPALALQARPGRLIRRLHHGSNRDHGLTGTDLALQQSLHGVIVRHIGGNIGDDLLLAVRKGEWQRRDEIVFNRVSGHAVALDLRDASRDLTSAVWQISASSYRNVCKALSNSCDQPDHESP
mgnify:CR=1 FL=1